MRSYKMASRFQLVDSDESDYEDEDSNEVKRVEDRRQWFDDSSEEEDETRVVRSQKVKKWEILTNHCAKIKNKLKIQDYVSTVSEFEELNKQLSKSENVIQVEGIPVFYIRTLARLEDAVNNLNKEAQKKLSSNNAKSFNKLKANLKKHNKNYEEDINKFRDNPVESEESSESESESEEKPKAKDKKKVEDKKAQGKGKKKSESEDEDDEDDDEEDDDDDKKKDSEEEDSVEEEWGEGSSEKDSSDVDERPVDPQNRRAFWTIKEDTKDKKEKEVDENRRKPRDKKEDIKEAKKEEMKKESYTPEVISAKLKEILERRTKKASNPEAYIQDVKNLLSYCKDSELSLQMLNLLSLLEIENSKDTITAVMPRAVWTSLNDYTLRTLTIYSPKLPLPENLDETRQTIIASLALRVERLSKELAKSFKYLDAKSSEYATRLSDTVLLSRLINKVYKFYEAIEDKKNMSRLAVLAIYEIHYIHDDLLEEMRTKSKDLTNEIFYSVKDSQAYINKLSALVFKEGELRDKVLTGLMVSYHHALHGRYSEARKFFLMSNTSSLHNDLTIQVFTNRVIVQIGLSAFYIGNVPAAFKSLNEIVSTHRLKELLAQTISLTKEKAAIQDDKKRAMPYHMYMSTDVIETVYFICAMITDLPKMAMNPSEPDKFTMSRYFKKLLDFHDRQASTGLTEGFREFIIAAAHKLRKGYWKEAYEVLEGLDTWRFVPRQGEVKKLLLENLKECGMITYLLTYSDYYENFSKKQLSEKFEIAVKRVEKALNPLILAGDIDAYWDGDFLILKPPSLNKHETSGEKSKEKAQHADMTEKLNELSNYLAHAGDNKSGVSNRKKKPLRRPT